jgi:superfamily II DNA or RNA helicase
VKAAIAALVLGPPATPERLGEIMLHPHQRSGADRALHLLRAFGGVLVADDVGLGKTFLALAIARGFQRPLVVVPAATRDAWTVAATRAGVGTSVLSFDSLVRGLPGAEPDLVVVDEAHHVRNPATKRFAAVAKLCTRAPVVLLSATPVQNRLDDLRVIMSLFLGERAHALSADDLATMIVRREASAITLGAIPSTADPEWLRPKSDVDCLDRLISLPPPIAVTDAGDGGALLTYTLVRQWASSRAALVSALRRRVARAHAIEDSLEAGRLPSRRELAAWCFADGAQQMAFSFMATGRQRDGVARLLETVRAHRLATRACVDWLAATEDPDRSRAELIAEIVHSHPGKRVVAFSEYAETVNALFRLLAPTLRVAVLTHVGGRTIGGHLKRSEILARFAPGSRKSTLERDRIDLLLTTDVLSEGVNLHDAGVVVHLDLPWNPARLAQRVGRVRRIGSPENTVLIFAMAPPAPAERMLELQSRLKAKLRVASRAVGGNVAVLPGLEADEGESSASVNDAVANALSTWHLPALALSEPICGAVQASRRGFLACIRIGDSVLLVGGTDSVTSDPMVLATLADAAARTDASATADECVAIETMIAAWLQRRGTIDVVDLADRRVARSRRALLQRVEFISQRTPRHARPTATPMLLAARAVAGATLSAGAEQVLDELTRSQLSDSAWLQVLAEFAALHSRPRDAERRILALLLLRPGPSACLT